MDMMKIGRALARGIGLAAFAFGAAGSAHAGYYTNFEPELDAIYSQSSFGQNPIDFRFASVLTITSASLATIDSGAEFAALGAMGVARPAVSAFLLTVSTGAGFPLRALTVALVFLVIFLSLRR